MAQIQSKYQGKPVVDKHGDLTDPVYYITNPAGAVHDCTEAHARARLRNPKFRLSTDAEIEQYLERYMQTAAEPIADPWVAMPEILPVVPASEAAPEKPKATPKAEELAKKHKIALAEIEATGANGQILVADVEAAIATKKK